MAMKDPNGDCDMTVHYYVDDAVTTRNAPPSDHDPLLASQTVETWGTPELHSCHNGLVVKRPFGGKWDSYQSVIDDLDARIGLGLCEKVELDFLTSDDLTADMHAAVGKLLTTAALPTPLSEQIRSDACSIALAVASMCASASSIDIKLEVFGEGVCKKWHTDNCVGRALVSYTGAIGTEYTRDSNVDFWELEHCGNNDCILREKDKAESLDVGDILFMKGRKYKGSPPLVHRSPEPRYYADGRVLNRLVLKVDVDWPEHLPMY